MEGVSLCYLQVSLTIKAEAYSKPFQTSKMERFAKKKSNYLPLAISPKRFTLDV